MGLRSMTGYGHAAAENPRYRVRVTLRSVNHRFLDVVLRLKDEQRASEPALRELLGETLSRGRVEVGVDVVPAGLEGARLEVDRPLLAQLSRALEGLLDEELIERGLTAGDLIRHPQLLRVAEPESRWRPEDEELLLGVAEEALAELVAARETEGAKLGAALSERLEALERAAADLRELAPEARDEAAAALRGRLEALLADAELDEARLAQEVAVLADRADVTEELDRLDAHVAHFHEVMATDGPVGKRLDFLTQEIFRELNTLGSKCKNAPMTRVVLDAKVLSDPRAGPERGMTIAPHPGVGRAGVPPDRRGLLGGRQLRPAPRLHPPAASHALRSTRGPGRAQTSSGTPTRPTPPAWGTSPSRRPPKATLV